MKITAQQGLAVKAQAHLFILFAQLLLEELNPAIVEALRTPEILKVLEKAQPGCKNYLTSDWSEEKFEKAAIEFSSLFLLPTGVQPFAKTWIPGERETVGDRVNSVLNNLIQQLALAIPPELEKVPKDHLSFLLYFAAWMLSSEHEEYSKGANVFIQEILSNWVPAFGKALHQKATIPVYKAIGLLLTRFFSN